jgi:uncharacterized membrane protein (UPF0127 family)
MRATVSCFDRAIALRVLALAAMLAASLFAWGDVAFKTAQVRVGAHALKVEVAASEPQRVQGLMNRERLGRDDGMLFVFDEPGYHSMWMKDTLIPLSVAFLDAQGNILNILDMEPRTLDTHTAAGPAAFAIETNKGWFAAKKIKAGDRVTGLPKVDTR